LEPRVERAVLLFGALGLFFVCLNIMNAIDNAAAVSDHVSDDRSSKIERNGRKVALRSQWSVARKSQFEIAGDATPESIDADIMAKKANDARRWQSTGGCSIEKITAGPSREFCAEVAGLERKKAAAVKRQALRKLRPPQASRATRI
jgi:hypothetical protein